jgi:hypothetical protein
VAEAAPQVRMGTASRAVRAVGQVEAAAAVLTPVSQLRARHPTSMAAARVVMLKTGQREERAVQARRSVRPPVALARMVRAAAAAAVVGNTQGMTAAPVGLAGTVRRLTQHTVPAAVVAAEEAEHSSRTMPGGTVRQLGNTVGVAVGAATVERALVRVASEATRSSSSRTFPLRPSRRRTHSSRRSRKAGRKIRTTRRTVPGSRRGDEGSPQVALQ